MTRPIVAALVAVALVAGCGQTTVTSPPSAPATSGPSPAATAAASSSPPSPESTPTAVASPMPLPQGSEAIVLDPALFAGVALDNPFWPMAKGSHWVYSETDGEGNVQQVDVTVLDETKEIVGIRATVVHDIVTEDGATVEDTLDWYAQDTIGNLWYLGEDTKEYENAKVTSTEGSWQTGVDGGQAGIILPPDPQVGMTWRQEWYTGQAEDQAEVLAVDEHVVVPAGTYDGVVRTRDFTPLEPTVEENKYYARGVGPVQEIQTKGGTSVDKLLEFTPGG